MKEFKHLDPGIRIYYGESCLKNLAKELKRENRERPLIFCDPAIASQPQLMELVFSALGNSYAGLFTNILPRSPLDSVKDGAAAILASNADSLIVIGGGSAAVTARAANILAFEKKDIREICSRKDANGAMISPKVMAPKIPHFMIPTTPTCATAKSGAAALDTATSERLQVFDPKTAAHAVFLHPAFAACTPESITLNAALSTYINAIEGLLTGAGDPLSDGMLTETVRMTTECLADYASFNDPDVRCTLLLASIMCGLGTKYTGEAIDVVLGHMVCEQYPVKDGFVNAIVLAGCLRFNAGTPHMHKIANALGILPAPGLDPTEQIIEKLEQILHGLPVPARLRDLGVEKESFPSIAASSMTDFFLRYNPKPVTEGDLIAIMDAAW